MLRFQRIKPSNDLTFTLAAVGSHWLFHATKCTSHHFWDEDFAEVLPGNLIQDAQVGDEKTQVRCHLACARIWIVNERVHMLECQCFDHRIVIRHPEKETMYIAVHLDSSLRGTGAVSVLIRTHKAN